MQIIQKSKLHKCPWENEPVSKLYSDAKFSRLG